MSSPPTEMSIDLRSAVTELQSVVESEISSRLKTGTMALSIVRVERPISSVSLIDFVRRAEAERKLYWRSRGGELEVAGLGAAEVITCAGVADSMNIFAIIHDRLENCRGNARYYGGFRFDRFENAKPIGGEWRLFGGGQFVLPTMEFVRTGEKTVLALQAVVDPAQAFSVESWYSEIAKCLEVDDTSSGQFPHIVSQNVMPKREQWATNVATALDAIEKRRTEKLVLARRVSCLFEQPVEMFALVERAFAIDQTATVFAFQLSQGVGFCGGTPELLYRRDGRQIFSEAVAGTRHQLSSAGLNSENTVQFLQSPKDRREVEIVREFIYGRLTPLCDTISTDEEPTIHQAGSVQHLRYQIAGNLRTAIGDRDILGALSPTPAVCGLPSETAIRVIRELEHFDRGWYAGPIGWIGKESAEFAVAIRSALVCDKTVHLYSGAGIVDGSSASPEWDELDAKIATLKAALGA